MAVFGFSPVYLLYVGAFGGATLLCGVALQRARRIEDRDTRVGLTGLVASSGGWALFELLFLALPDPGLKYGAYLVSLVVGLTTIGWWLYFCSAYTGRQLHRDTAIRRTGVAVYLLIVAVKLTNPVHGLYFTTTFSATPFPHLTVVHGTFHWVVTGLSYSLVTIGFFMLYEVFIETDYRTWPLGVAVGLTALPVVFDVLGYATTAVIDINYEPLGVALFAVSVLYLFEERFLAVQLTDTVDDAVLYLDTDHCIREFNAAAASLFPELDGATGDELPSVLPGVAELLDGDDQVLERRRDGETRYYLVSDSAFALGKTDIGAVLMFTDVTEEERRRRELERQNEQLEGFAAAIRHELLNTLQIVRGRVDIANDALAAGDEETARESLTVASDTASRMQTVVDDLSDLARKGQTLEYTETVDFETVVENAWNRAATDGLSLSVEGGNLVEAEPDRLGQLFQNAFTFSDLNDADEVTVRQTDDGFVIEDDGKHYPDADPAEFFEYGGAVPDAKTGMALPNLRTFARVHGWETDLDTAYDAGVRIVVRGVNVRPEAAVSSSD